MRKSDECRFFGSMILPSDSNGKVVWFGYTYSSPVGDDELLDGVGFFWIFAKSLL